MRNCLCVTVLFAACLVVVTADAMCGRGRRVCRGVKKCVSLTRVCDGHDDCGDNSDEFDCPGFTCPLGQFKCGRGGCIPARWRCDSEDDCADSSDEENCPTRGGQDGQQGVGSQGTAAGDDQRVEQQVVEDPLIRYFLQQFVVEPASSEDAA